MPITLDKVVEEIKSLTPREQHRLREILDTFQTNEMETAEIQRRKRALEQRLVDEGIISQIPSPISDLTPYQNRKLITIQGKPLSETILEERR